MGVNSCGGHEGLLTGPGTLLLTRLGAKPLLKGLGSKRISQKFLVTVLPSQAKKVKVHLSPWFS